MLATLLLPRQAPPEPHSDDSHLVAFAKLVGQLHFYIVACFAVFVWDILITLKLEVLYVWPSRFSLVKLCFFINRYLTLAIMAFLVACSFSQTLLENCGKFHLFQAYLPIVVFMCCNYKLVQRASSLFHDPRLVFYSLILVVLAQAVVQAVVSLKNRPIPMPPGVTGCYSFPSPENANYAFVYWLLPLFTQTIVLAITLAKVIQYWTRHGHSHLLDIFLRDGVHFFAVTASSNIVNVVYMKSKITIDGHKLSGSNFNSALALIINSMMVSRLIIHMRIALAEHTTVTYHTEEGATKTQAGTFFETLRLKLGFPTTPQSKYAQRRKDHHTEHGVTTIVDISALEKVGNTFSPGRRGSILRSSSASHESRYGGLHHGGGNKKNGAGQHGVTFDDSGDELPMKEIHVPMPLSPPAAAMPPRAITFDLPEGHALSSSLSGTTHISRGDIVDPEMMALNRRPTTATHGISQNGLGRAPRQADVPVLFVGEGYHHRSDVTSPPGTGINLKNAITVTTEKVTKAES